MCFSNAKKTNMTISLIETIQTGNTILAEKLIENHQFGNIDEQTSKNNGTALFWASCLGYINLVKLLVLYGADINARTAWKSTSLHAACDQNRIEIVKYLIKCGADVEAATINHDSALHLVAHRGFTLLSKILVEMGADVDSRNNKNHTPLDNAVNQGNIETANYLRSVASKGNGCKNAADSNVIDNHRLITYTKSVDHYSSNGRTVSISQQNDCPLNRQRRFTVCPAGYEPSPRRDNRTWPEQGTQRRSYSVHTRDTGSQYINPVSSDYQIDVGTQFPSMGTKRRSYPVDVSSPNDSFVFDSSLLNDLSIERKSSLSSDELTFRNIPI